MAIPEPARTVAIEQIEAFCLLRIPVELRSEIRLDYAARGDGITIVERRPPWRPDFGAEWTSVDSARLRYEPGDAMWSLDWKGSDDRWHSYDRILPTANVGPLLTESDADPTGVFRG